MISQEDWNDLFDVVKPVLVAKIRSLDPLEDLRTKSVVRIPYIRKVKQNAKSAFMVMSLKDLNWITLLLDAILTSAYLTQADTTVMLGNSTAKPRTGKQQMWETFVLELRADKSVTGADFSEGQLRHLPNLLDELSSKGLKFKGFGRLEFYDTASGEVLC